MSGNAHVTRVVSLAAAVLTAAATVLPPAIYFSLTYQRDAGAVESEAELASQLITRIVAANPDLWRYEHVRLAEFLSQRPRRGNPEQRRVLDLDGNTVAESADPLLTPWVTRSVQLLDAGTKVGTVEVSRSLRPLLLRTAWFALLLVPVAFLAFQALRTVPLRAIRRSERALRRQRDAAQRYLDVAGVAVVLLDARGRVSLVNRKCGEILARGVDDVVGKDWVSTFVEPRDRERVASELARLHRSERVLAHEYGVLRPSGERRVISWYLTPLSDREGGPAGLLGSGIDVTTERQLEEQLRHAQKMEAVGELASGVAHGFNNVLSTIKSYAAVLRKELPPSDPHLPHVDEILVATDRAVTLTRSLLKFSRHEFVRPEPADLVEVVGRAERLLVSLVGPGIEVRTALAPEPLDVMVDALQIEQVLMNLVTNARDAMPDGGRIDVCVARVELDEEGARRAGLREPGAYARVSVADTGVGIARELQPRVFEPFFTTKGVDRGTGLGLAIAYGVVKRHGGAIGVESEPGRGATFTFLLPLLANAGVAALDVEAAREGVAERIRAETAVRRAASAGRETAEDSVPRPPVPAATGRR